MGWRIPVETMERVDDTTARLLAGTLGTVPRGERDEVTGGPVLTPAEWRARTIGAAA